MRGIRQFGRICDSGAFEYPAINKQTGQLAVKEIERYVR